MNHKSIMSLEAASILISAQQISGYNSSIHCSYYAVLQYMKYILNETDNHPIEYNQQKSQGGESSHEYIIKAIKDRIENKYQARLLECEIYDLKNLRIKADYTQTNFTIDNAQKCKIQAESIINKLNQQFELL